MNFLRLSINFISSDVSDYVLASPRKLQIIRAKVINNQLGNGKVEVWYWITINNMYSDNNFVDSDWSQSIFMHFRFLPLILAIRERLAWRIFIIGSQIATIYHFRLSSVASIIFNWKMANIHQQMQLHICSIALLIPKSMQLLS